MKDKLTEEAIDNIVLVKELKELLKEAQDIINRIGTVNCGCDSTRTYNQSRRLLIDINTALNK